MIKKLKKNKQLIITLAAIVVIAAVFGVYQLISYDGNKTDAQKYKEQGDKYYESMDFRNALNFYNMALEAEPAYEEVYIILYEHFMGEGDRIKAREIIAQAAYNIDSERINNLYDSSDYIVEFKNEEFERSVRSRFRLGEGELWRSELDYITSLAIFFTGEEYFEDLNHFKNLSEYRPKNDTIVHDINMLLSHPAIVSMYLDSGTWNLSEIQNSESIQSFHINNVKITGSLSEDVFPNLTRLYLVGGEVEDINVFSHFTGLEEFGAYNIDIGSVLPFVELTKLTDFTLENCNIKDISPLTELKNLERLDIAYNMITDISPLYDMELEVASVHGNPFYTLNNEALWGKQIFGLPRDLPVDEDDFYVHDWNSEYVKRSVFINIYGYNPHSTETQYILNSQIKEIEAIYLTSNEDYYEALDLSDFIRMPALQVVRINGFDIADLSPLTGLENLEMLRLSDVILSDTSPLGELVNLKGLSVNTSEDFTPLPSLEKLTELELLQLTRCRLTDINELKLSALTNLKRLYLDNNKISDISSLSGLYNLFELDIGGNLIEDFSPITKLPELTILKVNASKRREPSIQHIFEREDAYWEAYWEERRDWQGYIPDYFAENGIDTTVHEH